MENKSGQAEDRAEDGEETGTEEVGASHTEAETKDALRDSCKDNPAIDGKYSLSVYVENQCGCGACGNLTNEAAIGMALSGKQIDLRCNHCGQLMNLKPAFTVVAQPKVPPMHMDPFHGKLRKELERRGHIPPGTPKPSGGLIIS